METFTIVPFHSDRGCLSYLVTDHETKEAMLIDPSEEIEGAYADYFSKHRDVKLLYILETHTHADHVSLGRKFRETTGAKLGMSEYSPSPSKDIALKDGESVMIGKTEISVWYTPGHTNESLSFRVGENLFTGDMLLIGGTGRTDFQLGESDRLYKSLVRVLSLPDETVIYPAHNYKGEVSTTLAKEKEGNERLKLAVQGRQEEFISLMNIHQPPAPELFDISIRENTK